MIDHYTVLAFLDIKKKKLTESKEGRDIAEIVP